MASTGKFNKANVFCKYAMGKKHGCNHAQLTKYKSFMMISLANRHQLIDVKLLIKSHKNRGTSSGSDLRNTKWQRMSILHGLL